MAGGRPSKLSEEVKETLVEGIEAGLPYKLACEAAGIGYSTFRDWMKNAEKIAAGEGKGIRNQAELLKFSEDVKRAEAEGAKTLMALIWSAASEGTWQAAAWILERRHKQDFSLRTEHGFVPGADGGEVELTLKWTDTPQTPGSLTPEVPSSEEGGPQ